jgi:hypothetical protein
VFTKCHHSHSSFPSHGHSDTAEKNKVTSARCILWSCACIPHEPAFNKSRLLVRRRGVFSRRTPFLRLARHARFWAARPSTVTSQRWCGRIIVSKEGTESTVLFPHRSLMARGYSMYSSQFCRMPGRFVANTQVHYLVSPPVEKQRDRQIIPQSPTPLDHRIYSLHQTKVCHPARSNSCTII